MSNEELCGQEVSKVDSVLTSLYNDEVSKLGNSAVQSQGREIPKMIFCWGDYHNAVIKFYSNISLYSLLITVNAQVTSGGKVPTKPRGCNRSHIPKVLEHSSGLPNPQPSHEPPFPRPPPPPPVPGPLRAPVTPGPDTAQWKEKETTAKRGWGQIGREC